MLWIQENTSHVVWAIKLLTHWSQSLLLNCSWLLEMVRNKQLNWSLGHFTFKYCIESLKLNAVNVHKLLSGYFEDDQIYSNVGYFL